MLNNSIEMVTGFYAICAAGMICVPLDFELKSRNLDYIMNDCDIKSIFTSKKYLPRFENTQAFSALKIILIDENIIDNKVFFLWDEILQDTRRSEFPKLEISPSDPACILYTTGTTGLYKGVLLSHFSLSSAVKNINQFMQIKNDIIESLPMRLSHSFGLARMRCVFDVGGTVILENGFLRPEFILHHMKIRQANALASVPAGFAMLLELFPDFFKAIGPQIKYIEIGSAPMPMKLKNQLIEICPQARICMHYGLTEASRAAFLDFRRDNNHLDTEGKPSPQVSMKIVNKQGQELGHDTSGEIAVKGNMLMSGYWGKPELTNKVLKNGWLLTGDLGLFDKNGYLHLVGRKEDVLNLGGLKVAALEIEQVLLGFRGITDAAVTEFLMRDKITSPRVKAYIVVEKPTSSFNLMKLKKYCLKELESYKIPSEFVIVDRIPRSSSGKIKRHLLKKTK